MIARFVALVALAASCSGALAQEFRAINPIRTPGAKAPAGAVRVAPPAAVRRESVEDAVGRVASAWNTPDLAGHLGGGFPDRTRLLDAIASGVPRDARIRVLGIQGFRVLDQFDLAPTAQVPMTVRVSQVSVTVRTQVEFTDAAGFQALDGTNELVIDLKEPRP